MANRFPPTNYRVVQKVSGAIAPRIQLLLMARYGWEGLERVEQRNRDRDDRVRARVDAERAGAVAHGVHVVVDETRTDHYTLADLPDE